MCAPTQLSMRRGKCFGSGRGLRMYKGGVVDKVRRLRWKRLGSNCTDRIQSDPIRTSGDYRESRVTLYTIPSVVFCNCLFVLSMGRSLLLPSSCRFVCQVGSNQSTSMLVVSLSTSCVRSYLQQHDHCCFCRPMSRYHTVGVQRKVSKMTCSATECSRSNTMLDRDAWLSPDRY